MRWLATIFAGTSLVLIYFNVGPQWVQYLFFAIGLALFLLILIESTSFFHFKTTPRFLRKKGGFFVIIALLLALSIMSRRYEIPFDLSRAKLYSLRDQTIAWLKKVDVPIQIIIFVRNDDKTFHFANWLQKQVSEQSSFVTVLVKNINKEVQLAKQYDIHLTGETVLVSGEHWTKVENFKEATLLPGLMRLLTKAHASLCFSVGHGEPDLRDQSGNGLYQLHNFLTKVGYKTTSVSLEATEVDEIEKNCGVFFVVSPRTQFLPPEEEKLFQLASRKATPLVLAVDPPYSKVVSTLLHKEGISLSSNLVTYEKNLENKIPKTDIILYPSQVSTLLNRLRNKIYLPEVLALEAIQSDEPIQWQPLLTTPPEADYQLMGEKSEFGYFNLGFYGTVDGKPRRVVLGTGNGFLSKNVNFGDNSNLVLSTIGWLLEEQNMQWVLELGSDPVYMSLSDRENFWVQNMSMYGLPSLAFTTLFIYWFQRRVRS